MLDRPFRVRTPESVVFSYREAGAYSRLLAWSLDSMILAGILLGGGSALSLLGGVTFGLTTPLVYIFGFAVTSGYFIFCEWRTGGTSPGKRALGLRVVRDDGLRLTLAQCVVRNLLRVVDSLPLAYGIALVTAGLSRESRRLGDHVARSVVVAEPRISIPTAPGAERSQVRLPGLADVARRRLSPEERDLVVAAVLRREELKLAARVEIFAGLARHLAARLSVSKPAHLSDERFVCEVAIAVAGAAA